MLSSIRREVLQPDFIVFLLAFPFSIYFFYPGAMSPDSFFIYEQAVHGIVSDLHPSILTHIWRASFLLGDGPIGMLVIQVFVQWLSLIFIGRCLFESKTKRVVFLFVIGFWPPIFSLTGVIWKDVLMTSLLLLATAFQLGAVRTGSKFLLITSAPVIILAAMTRHNGVLCLIPMGFVYLNCFARIYHFPYSRFWRVFTSTLISLALILICQVISSTIAGPSAHQLGHLFIYDLYGMSRLLNTDLVRERFKMEDFELMKERYTPTGNVPLYCDVSWPPGVPYPDHCERKELGDIPDEKILNAKEKNEEEEEQKKSSSCPRTLKVYEKKDLRLLFRTWAQEIVRSPKAYLRHRVAVFKNSLNLGNNFVCYPYQDSYIYSLSEKTGVVPPSCDSFRYRLNRLMTSFWYEMRNSTVFRPWPYFLLGHLILLIAVIRAQVNVVMHGALLSSLLYSWGYLVCGLSCEVRLHLWTMVICSIMCFTTLVEAISHAFKRFSTMGSRQ